MTSISWLAGNGNWGTPGKWSSSAVPGASDDALIAAGGFYTVSITAPITATHKLQRLKPVTPDDPKAVKIHPPTTAPTIPKMMSRKIPSPDLLTPMLPSHPAMAPKTIHPRTDIMCLRECS